VIRDNILCHAERAVVHGDRDFTAANPVMSQNLTFATAPLPGDNLNGRDPLFVDGPKRDFRLQKGSPAIGAGADGTTIGALAYPNVYYVDPKHPAASDDPAWGYPAVPLATLAKACAMAAPGETVMLRGGVYRELLRPKSDDVTFRAAPGERVTISGADLIEGWTREADGRWSAHLASPPRKVLRDGQPWAEFSIDPAHHRIVVKGEDPRLHVFEAIARRQGIDLTGNRTVKVEGITVVNTL
jgi:hypothetical protein